MASKRIIGYLLAFIAGVVLASLIAWQRTVKLRAHADTLESKVYSLKQANRQLSDNFQKAVERGVWAEGRRILCEQKCPQ